MKISRGRKILITAIALLGFGTTTGMSGHYANVEGASAQLTKQVAQLTKLKNREYVGAEQQQLIETDAKLSHQKLRSGDATKIKRTTQKVQAHVALIKQVITDNAGYHTKMQALIPTGQKLLSDKLITPERVSALKAQITSAQTVLQHKNYDDYAAINTDLADEVTRSTNQVAGTRDYLKAKQLAVPVLKTAKQWTKNGNVNAQQTGQLNTAITAVQNAQNADDVKDAVDTLHGEIADSKALATTYQQAKGTLQSAQTLAATSAVKSNEKQSLNNTIHKLKTATSGSAGTLQLANLKDKISRVNNNIKTRQARAVAAQKAKAEAAEAKRVAAQEAAARKAADAAEEAASRQPAAPVSVGGWTQAPAGQKYLKDSSGCYYGQVKNPDNFSLISEADAYANYRPGHGNGSAKQ